MEKIELHPQVFLIEDFLSEAECDDYIALSEGKTFEEAKINVGGRQMMSKGIRNNDRLMIFDNKMAENLFRKASEFLPQEHENCNLLNFNEMFRVYKYSQDSSLKCTGMEAISEMKRKKFLYIFNLSE